MEFRRWINLWAGVLGLAICSVAAAAPTVTQTILVSEKRVARTIFEYTYKIVVKNDATSRTNVLAKLTRVGAGSSIVKGQVNVGDLVANAAITPADTFTIRHDRTVPLQISALIWEFQDNPAQEVGILLPGKPADLAISQITGYNAHYQPKQTNISALTGNPPVLRTVVSVSFKQGTTVGQINALLQEIGGRIVLTLDKTALVYVRIPDPGSPIGLEVTINRIKAHAFIAFVGKIFMSSVNALPRSVLSTSSAQFDAVQHHLAVGAHAAWNAMTALSSRSLLEKPIVLIPDRFGAGEGVILRGTGLIPQKNDVLGTQVTLVPVAHGYHVAGILAGRFDDQASGIIFPEVTGMFPGSPVTSVFGAGPLEAKLIDLSDELPDKLVDWDAEPEVARALRYFTGQQKRNVVLNISFGLPNASALSQADRDIQKRVWLNLVRGGDPIDENRYFHSAAAGNVGSGEDDRANVASATKGWSAAGLDGDLKNTMVVENRRAIVSSSDAKVVPGCISPRSYTGGNISAIGVRIVDGDTHGIISYDFSGRAIELTGTSMAAPQVAGLAAYLWSLAPSLTGNEIFRRIRDNARGGSSGCADNGQPVIDAYATILTADKAETVADAKVRFAILDANNDGKFDEVDLINFKTKLTTSTSERDYSQNDLNGDGFTGGSNRERLNLDMDFVAGSAASKYASVSRIIAGTSQSFDEAQLTDAEILCYYANGPLYQGDKTVRDSLLSQFCGLPPVCSATFKYKLTPLAFSTGRRRFNIVTGLNNNGESIGSTDDLMAAKWDAKGAITIFPKFDRCDGTGGRPSSSAFGLNNKGQVVGERCSGFTSITTLWDPDGSITDLWQSDMRSSATGAITSINDNGELVGTWSYDRSGFHNLIYRNAKGQQFQIPHLVFAQWPVITNTGQTLVLLNKTVGSNVKTVFEVGPPLGPKTVIDVPLLAGYEVCSPDTSFINDKGQIATTIYCSGHAVNPANWGSIYDKGGWQLLFRGKLTGLNNFGDVVGIADKPNRFSAISPVVVRDGKMLELDSCVDVVDPVNNRLGVQHINDRGQIIANLTSYLGTEFFLMSPVPR